MPIQADWITSFNPLVEAGWVTSSEFFLKAEWLTSLEPHLKILALLLSAAALHLLTKRVVLRLFRYVAGKIFPRAKAFFGDEPFRRLALIVPYLVIITGAEILRGQIADHHVNTLQRIATAIAIILIARVISALLDRVQVAYQRSPRSHRRPIKGYLQVTALVIYGLAIIFAVAALINKSPVLLISGLGAATAVLMLIFRDTLLSFVAGVQLTANDLLQIGDWIEMPQFNADGDVIDINLNTVKVQNFDKTVTIIPAHKFLENSFKNYRSMQESGGRRIKRSLLIDLQSVRFLTEADVEKFSRFFLLTDYVAAKRQELTEYNSHMPKDLIASSRRLTNLGTFRAYVSNYLREHPKIHKDRTFLVRQLQPTPEGLPLEIYVFANDTKWANYENIQSDIFDHLIAILPEFDLQLFQAPSGANFTAVLSSARGNP